MTAQFPPANYGPPPGQGPPSGYGAPGYGPPSGYGAPGYGRPRLPRRGNPVGIIIAAVGGVLALLGTLVAWYEPDAKLADLIQALDHTDEFAFAKAYFGYLMWVLLAVTVVLALFGNAATPLATFCRIAAPIAGVVGAALVIASLNQLNDSGSIFDHAKPGLFLVLAGFVIAGGAGVLGPLKTRPSFPPGYPPR